LGWPLGYPFSLVLMAFTSLTLYLIFKRRGWM
jgi:magnesium transporter